MADNIVLCRDSYSPEGIEHTVHNCAHACIEGKHVIDIHQDGPPKLRREIASQQVEDHGDDVQHDCLLMHMHCEVSEPAPVLTKVVSTMRRLEARHAIHTCICI